MTLDLDADTVEGARAHLAAGGLARVRALVIDWPALTGGGR